MTRPQDDPRGLSELLAAALMPEDEAAWPAVAALHWRGDRETFLQACALCTDARPLYRARGASILSQLGIPERVFASESYPVVLPLLGDAEDEVRASAIFALHHLDADKAVSYVLPFARDSAAEVRQAVAFALGQRHDDASVCALIALTADVDAEVRDWATFGLGQAEADSSEVRSALIARLADDNADVVYEAVCGLGRRGDQVAGTRLKAMLGAFPDDVSVVEAACGLLGLDPAADHDPAALAGAL